MINSSEVSTRESFLNWGNVTDFTARYGTILGIVAIAIVFSILTPAFFNLNNIMNILLQSSVLTMVSIGMTIALILKGVDLTIGYVADLSALVTVTLLIAGQNIVVSILAGVIAGLIIGFINGTLINFGVPALVGTLGMMFVIKSLELIITGGGQSITIFSLDPSFIKYFTFIGQGYIGFVPAMVIITAILVFLIYLLIYHTKIGRYFHAIGGNVKAAYLSGVKTKFYFGLGFVLSGLFAGIAGIMMSSRTGIAQPEGSIYLLLDAFVAAYIGSITFRKGQMNIMGTVIGALMVSELTNGVTVMGLDVAYQYVFKGLLIFLAVLLAHSSSKN